MDQQQLLAFYAAPGPFTELADREVDALPADPAALARVVQGLLIHEGLGAAYNLAIPADRVAEKQLHGVAALLRRARDLDDGAIAVARSPERRVVGVCRHFATLFVAFMRRKGVPARARCGFAGYFAAGKFVDHWVGEYWNAAQQRWVLVDAQIDDVQRRLFGLAFDPLDTPRDRFLVAGDAWRTCREGADPTTFGVAGTKMWGLVEVYGDLFQDLAALQKIELLPWGWYGLATDESGMGELALIDRLARISSDADAGALDILGAMIAQDPRLGVPGGTIDKILRAEQPTPA
jgi:hypothetical protein